MLKNRWLMLAMITLDAAVALAQAPTPVIRPVVSVSPVEVHADRTVTFRVWAPRASAVGVMGDFPPVPGPEAHLMTKDERGVWTVTLGPFPSNIWTYNFLIDGVQLPWELFDVPSDQPQFYSVRAVPHGTVHQARYHSKSLGVERTVYVYTPPGYPQSTTRYHPVLYLLHPAGGTGAPYWTVVGQANFILDNLIADGRAKAMVVVMPFGYPRESDRDRFGQRRESVQDHKGFEADLLGDLIPFVERSYRVSAEAGQRAIAGASMGGLQALTIGVAHLETFGWIAGFSALGGLGPDAQLATVFAPLLTDPAQSNKRIRLLWFAVGDQEKRLMIRNQEFSTLLTQHGIRHTFSPTPGWAHQVQLWRQNLHDFARLLFSR